MSTGISTTRFRALRDPRLVVPFRRPGAVPPQPLASLDELVFAKIDGHRTREDLSMLIMVSDVEIARVLDSLEARGLVVVDRGGPDAHGDAPFDGGALHEGEIDDALSLMDDSFDGALGTR
ncbi:MAG: hypothetical protein IPJ34_15500 [Myxococcales bacterium]|nr:hypothetical protein [Myxococcales bacterium]MBL8718033.1 hypothetical protein [Myxococcales bacterium]